jgi:Type II secretion system (T2SS), protein G
MQLPGYNPEIARQLLICTIVGVAMTGTAYLCAWYSTREANGYRWPHLDALSTLRELRAALDESHKGKGKYPEILADLRRTHSEGVRFEDDGQVVDPWRNPYQYHANESSYSLFSFGRDGKLGGEGLDEDLDVRVLGPYKQGLSRRPAVGSPTLRQFTFECPTQGVMITCAMAGICAFLACLFSQRTLRPGMVHALIRLGLTLIACLATAVFMSFLHVPTHH